MEEEFLESEKEKIINIFFLEAKNVDEKVRISISDTCTKHAMEYASIQSISKVLDEAQIFEFYQNEQVNSKVEYTKGSYVVLLEFVEREKLTSYKSYSELRKSYLLVKRDVIAEQVYNALQHSNKGYISIFDISHLKGYKARTKYEIITRVKGIIAKHELFETFAEGAVRFSEEGHKVAEQFDTFEEYKKHLDSLVTQEDIFQLNKKQTRNNFYSLIVSAVVGISTIIIGVVALNKGDSKTEVKGLNNRIDSLKLELNNQKLSSDIIRVELDSLLSEKDSLEASQKTPK